MKCDTGLLKAYADEALLAVERAQVEAHLASCTACRDELAGLRARAAAVSDLLSALEPNPAEAPSAAQSLVRFRIFATAQQETHAGLWATLERSLTMLKETLGTRRWRPLAIGAAAVACLVILFSFAPVRQVAADFLGVFRVRKFAVIPVDQTQQQKLESLAKMAEDGKFGEPTIVRKPGKPQAVADLAEASKLVGFTVAAPQTLPAGATSKSLTVETGPAIHYEMDRAAMQALLDATHAQGVTLPPGDKVTIDVDVPPAVTQDYVLGSGVISITQMTSPQVDIPAGIDPVAISEAGFKFLGIPDADARRLAQSIDWTNTLVIPLPTNILQYREVTVAGASGLLIENRPDSNARYRGNMLLWQKNGILFAVHATNVDPLLVMQMADSLK